MSSLVDNFLVRTTKRDTDVISRDFKYQMEVPNGFYTVKEMKTAGLIKEKYLDIVPDKCECGCDLIINESLTILKCCNLRCVHTLAASVEKIAKQYGVSGIGGATSLKMLKDRQCTSVLDLFTRPPALYEEEFISIKNQPRDFAECVKLLCLPNINATALTVFKGISSYDEYLSWIEYYGSLTNFVKSRVGGEGQLAGNISTILKAYNYELARIEEVFTLKAEALMEIDLAMTGNVKLSLPEAGISRFTKDAYIKFINGIYPEHVVFRRTESVGKAFVCIADYQSTSAKYKAAESMDKLWTSEDFLHYIMDTDTFFKDIFGDDWERYRDEAYRLRIERYGENSIPKK